MTVEGGDEATVEKPKTLDLEKVGYYEEDGKLLLKSGEHKKIFTHFKNLYINRVQHVGSQKKFSRDFVDIHARDTHKPIISEKTAKLAMKKRQKCMAITTSQSLKCS